MTEFLWCICFSFQQKYALWSLAMVIIAGPMVWITTHLDDYNKKDD